MILSTFYYQGGLLGDNHLKMRQNRHVLLEEEGSELQYTNRRKGQTLYFMLNSPLSRYTKLVGIPKHIIQRHLSSSSELVIAVGPSAESPSTMVPRPRVFNPPITWSRVAKEHEKESEQYINEYSCSGIQQEQRLPHS